MEYPPPIGSTVGGTGRGHGGFAAVPAGRLLLTNVNRSHLRRYAHPVDHTPHTFRFSFISPFPHPAVEERIRENLGADVIYHGNLTVITANATAYRPVPAGINLIEDLVSNGVAVERTQPDLVNRRMIAERAGCTRQAISLWVKGQRHQHDPFPIPASLIPAETWLWGDVNDWLARNSYPHDSDHTSLTLEDHARLDAYLVTKRDEYRELAAAAREQDH